MGIRSDLGIAIKAEYVQGFKDYCTSINAGIMEWASETSEVEAGLLLVLSDVKIYCNPVDQILDYLRETVGSENYKTVEACSEYPESTDGDFGEWNDNPWYLGRNVSVSISFQVP